MKGLHVINLKWILIVFTDGTQCLQILRRSQVLLFKALCGSEDTCVKSDKLLPVMFPESVSIGAEDYKFEKGKKNLRVRKK